MGELIDVGDTRLFVNRKGAGPALIVLHGGPGADHTQLLGPLAPLDDEFTLYFVDQRSQGRSDPAPRETWTFQQAASANTADMAPWEVESLIDRFIDFYNNERLHQGLNYVTPAERHDGRHVGIIEARKRGLQEAKRQRRIEAYGGVRDDR